MKTTPKKGTILYDVVKAVENHPFETGNLVKLWKQFFPKDELNQPSDPVSKKRLRQLLAFRAIERTNPAIKGQLYNISRWGIYCGKSAQSPEEKIQLAVENYRLGQIASHRLFPGIYYGRYAVTLEPHFGIKGQEAMWSLNLSDLEQKGSPNLARMGVNFHYENGRPVMSVVVIQGKKEKKAELDAFYRRFHQPWPIFMIQHAQFLAEKGQHTTIRGLPERFQPFFGKEDFKSGKDIETILKEGRKVEVKKGIKKAYSLYDRTFQQMDFLYKNKYFELRSPTGAFLSVKRRTKIGKGFQPQKMNPRRII